MTLLSIAGIVLKQKYRELNSSYNTKYETYKAILRIILPCQISPLHSDRLKAILVKAFLQITDMGYPTKPTWCPVSLIFLTAPLKESCWHMVFLGNRVMGEGTSPLLSPINLSLSQDLGRPKALMAIYIERQSLRIVSQFLWQHSSYKNTA